MVMVDDSFLHPHLGSGTFSGQKWAAFPFLDQVPVIGGSLSKVRQKLFFQLKLMLGKLSFKQFHKYTGKKNLFSDKIISFQYFHVHCFLWTSLLTYFQSHDSTKDERQGSPS